MKTKSIILGVLALVISFYAHTQVGIGTTTPDGSSVLDITSTDKGILIPRMTVLERIAITTPADGLMVYQIDDLKGFYFYDSASASWDRVLKQSRDAIPVGSIFTFPVSTTPVGYLVCDGSAVSRTTYADLFALIGVTYGNGNGSTTFNLPDYRGKFLRGLDDGAGIDPEAALRLDRGDGTTGDVVGTNQDSAMLNHLHQVNPPSTNTTSGGNHNHSVNPLNGNTSNSGNHNHVVSSTSVWTDLVPTHTHRLRGREANISYSTNPFGGGGNDFVLDDNGNAGPDFIDTSSANSHRHNVTIPSRTTNSEGDHNHNVTISAFNTNSDGNHAHIVNIPTFDSGLSGTALESRPINISVIYCIKY